MHNLNHSTIDITPMFFRLPQFRFHLLHRLLDNGATDVEDMGQAISLPTKPILIKFKLTKPKPTSSEPTKPNSKKSRQANSKPTRPPNTLRPSQTPLNGRPLKDEDLPWRISGRSGAKFSVRKLYRGPSIWHQYGWKKCHNHGHEQCKNKDPTVLFTCKMIPKQSRHLRNIDTACRNVVITFVRHRNEMSCGCSLEYITNGTARKTVNICEIRDKAVHKAIEKHDKICACGTFEFLKQETGKSIPRKTTPHPRVGKTCHAPASSKTHTRDDILASRKVFAHPPKHPSNQLKDSFGDLSDDYKENIFKGLPRPW